MICSFQTNLAGVTGVGRTSGIELRLTGAASVSQACTVPGISVFGLTYAFVPADALVSGFPADPMRLEYSAQIDAERRLIDAVAVIVPAER